jgi:sulfur-oxidizing protein SoxY
MTTGLTRRAVLGATVALAVAPRPARPADADLALLEELFGTVPAPSERLLLEMPTRFPNGYTVPLTIEVDSPMSAADYVRSVHVVAPHNPLVRVASFHFTPASGRGRVSTRIRLAMPQNVLVVAEMSDGSLLRASAWVAVETDGCA